MCYAPTLPQPSTAEQAAAELAGRTVSILNDAALALMTSVGHRTGLFDTMAGLPPASSHAIAEAAGLDERYVREWLGAMTTGGLVRYDETSRTWSLPAPHAASLTRAAGPNNLAMLMQWIGVMASVEDRIVDCFRDGGGVPYESFRRFHEVMAEDSSRHAECGLLEAAVPLVDGLRERLEAGIEVLEIGCGAGDSALALARTYPASRVTGIDLGAEAIERGRDRAAREGVDNLHLEIADAAGFDRPGRYGLVLALDAIHDQAEPARVLANARRALTPDGVFLMKDIGLSSFLERNLEHPFAPFIYSISCMHCMTVSLARDGAGLGAAWGEELALEMLADAGFGPVRVERFENDPVNSWYVAAAA